jgi:regulator of RNase E activity RraA
VPSLTERLAQCYTGAVHDVLRMMGHDNIVLPSTIRRLHRERSSPDRCGRFPAHRSDRRATKRSSAVAATARAAPAGHVVVCQPNNHEIALMEELTREHCRRWRVNVVDGGSRDTDLVLAQRFPVFCAFLTPADIVERWIPDRYGEPITIGTVTLVTGDYLLGDRDGVVIVPRAIAEEVVAKTEEVVATESDMRRALTGGMDPVAAYEYGKFWGTGPAIDPSAP